MAKLLEGNCWGTQVTLEDQLLSSQPEVQHWEHSSSYESVTGPNSTSGYFHSTLDLVMKGEGKRKVWVKVVMEIVEKLINNKETLETLRPVATLWDDRGNIPTGVCC